jgi:AhpD family alkylhydroperoxidase
MRGGGIEDQFISGYNHFRERFGFTPQEQEVVLLSISRSNGCAYYMAAHSFIADRMSGLSKEVTEAIRVFHTPVDGLFSDWKWSD